MEQKTIKEYIRALEHMTAFMRSLLDDQIQFSPAPTSERDMLLEFTDLRMLAKSESWPSAISEDMICPDDEDSKLARAAGIIKDFIRTDLYGKKFLDYGCGEGHVSYLAANLYNAKQVCGYDINKGWQNFEVLPNLHFSNDINELADHGPFDVILLHDVIDHCEDPYAVLETVRSLKTPEIGKIIMRCHPWTSRTGTHLYKDLNKAYLHLVFDQKELLNVMGLKGLSTINIVNPLETYRKLISDSGFSIIQEDIIKQPVELFFTTNEAVLRRIQESLTKRNNAFKDVFPREILEIQFIDYVLI